MPASSDQDSRRRLHADLLAEGVVVGRNRVHVRAARRGSDSVAGGMQSVGPPPTIRPMRVWTAIALGVLSTTAAVGIPAGARAAPPATQTVVDEPYPDDFKARVQAE